MKTGFYLLLIIGLFSGCQSKVGQQSTKMTTVCNPLDISYRFCLDEPSRREAADPTIILFRDTYFLFASKSGGYWYSNDLVDWTFIETSSIPTEEYAPTVVSINDTLYFLASSNEKSTIYKTVDPFSGRWEIALDSLKIPVWDPFLFLDEDNRLYLYWGCSDKNPIFGIELNHKDNFAFIGEPRELIFSNKKQHGWEVPGDFNTNIEANPWIEGAWLNKYQGTYYLQYSGPGTEFKSYSDGVYTSDNPLGPFKLASHNPFAYKPGGFATGAGHGSTFMDKHRNFWHIGTVTISEKHIFERRLAIFPAFFDKQGILHATTKFGDYPQLIPNKKIEHVDEIFSHWMLLSFNKKVDVSSALDSLPPENMTDENIRTYWAAQSGDSNEFAIIDLGDVFEVSAIQINFAEHNTNIFGRQNDKFHRYILEISDNNKDWNMLIDKSQNISDHTHDYTQLDEKVRCRYVKIINLQVPGGHFAISGFRIFGIGSGKIPQAPQNFQVRRNPDDRRNVKLTWATIENATGYNIRFGSDKDKLYHNYMIYQDSSLEINSLNSNQPYYFAIESFNENGISSLTKVHAAE